jgi:hypothetical protein
MIIKGIHSCIIIAMGVVDCNELTIFLMVKNKLLFVLSRLFFNRTIIMFVFFLFMLMAVNVETWEKVKHYM